MTPSSRPEHGPGPLAGRRVVVTRAREDAPELAAPLAALGAEVRSFPTIRILPPADPRPLEEAAARAGSYDWIVLTSVRAVEAFFGARARRGGDAGPPLRARVCAIGPATRAALERYGASAALIPEVAVAESVVDALRGSGDLRGLRFLLPRADIARALLPEALREAGAVVDAVEAYRTLPGAEDPAALRAEMESGRVDAVAFTSGSTVRGYVAAVGPETGGARVASIGPITSAAAREHGLPVDAEAVSHTVPGLVSAILGLLQRR